MNVLRLPVLQPTGDGLNVPHPLGRIGQNHDHSSLLPSSRFALLAFAPSFSMQCL